MVVGWVERMHGRDTALNVGSCNATTMHPLHHQQFNLFHISRFYFLTFQAVFFSPDFLAVEYPSCFPTFLAADN